MVAELFGGGGDTEQFRRGDAFARGQPGHAKLAGGQGAGLVEHERVDAGGGFEVSNILHEHAEPGSGGERGDHRGWRGENHGARTSDDQKGDDAVPVVGEKPDHRGDHEDGRGVVRGVPVNDSHDRQPGAFGGEDQIAHLADGGIRANARDNDLDHTGQVLCAGENFFLRPLVARK